MSDQIRKYSFPIVATAVTAQLDLFEITAGANNPVTIVGWEIGQSTDYGDAQAEGAYVSLIQAYTVSGSGGNVVTPAPMFTGDTAAAATCETLNTTLANTGTPLTRAIYPFNWQIGHQIWFPDGWGIRIAGSTRVVLLMGAAPTDSITISGTVYFYES
jgi:hypothetical protein